MAGWKTAIGGVAVGVGIIACVGAILELEYGTEGRASSAVSTPAARTFTPDQFSSYAINRTKAQIRAEFGAPDQVEEGQNEWFYDSANTNLIVRDPDAAKQVYVAIDFGVDRPDDQVSGVTY
jgi:hypothetical protein